MSSQKNEIFVDQLDLDLIKTEDSKIFTESPDCLETTLVAENEIKAELAGSFLVCTVCLTTDNVDPLPLSARWLLKRAVAVCGVCAVCVADVRRATMLLRLVKRAQAKLEKLIENGELSKSAVSSLEKQDPLVKLSRTPIELWGSVSKQNITSKREKVAAKPTFVEVDDQISNDAIESDNIIDETITNEINETYSNGIDESSDEELLSKIKLKVKRNYDKSRKKVAVENDRNEIDENEIPDSSDEESNDLKKDNSVKDILSALNIDDFKGNKRKILEDLTRLIKRGPRRETLETPEKDQLIEKYFESRIVPLEEQREEFTKRRNTEDYERSIYKCDVCYKGFDDSKALEEHLSSHSKDSSCLICNVCDKQCNTAPGFYKHAFAHLEAKRYFCRKCDFNTNRKQSARVHSAWHHGKRYECDQCGLVLKRLSNLLSHQRVRHPSSHVCALCGFAFVGAKGLHCHKLIVHKNEDYTIPEDGPTCVECDLLFKTAEALATHRRVSPKHGGSVSNQRPAKGNLMRLKTAGRRRKRDEKDPKNLREYHEVFKCEQCNEQMYSRRAYRMHFNKLHADCARTQFPDGATPCLCDLCGRTFMSAAALNEHARCAHGGDAIGKYKCDICNKVFQKSGSFATHKNVHEGRKFPCPICGKAFNQAFNRDRHYTYVHSDVKDFKCDFCEKHFKSSAEKNIHITYVHLKKPYNRTKRRSHAPKRKRDNDMWVEGSAKGTENLVVNDNL